MCFAAYALIMTGCSKQEVTDNVDAGRGQLSFAPGLGKQSRAAEWTNTSLQGAALEATPIAMYAYQESATTPLTFEEWFNDDLFYDPDAKTWKIGSTRFRNTAVTKYATYFPQTLANLKMLMDGDDPAKNTFETANFTPGGAGKFPAFEYTVAATSDVQEDLLAGVTEVKANMSNITVGMRHILSQVNFGTVGYEGAKIAIRNIQIVGLSNNAIYKYGATDKAPVGAWETFKGAATYTYYDYSNTDKGATNSNLQPITPLNAQTGDCYIFGDGGNWGPGKGATTFYPVGAGNGWKNHSAGTASLDNSLMLIPQTLTPTSKVTFEYQITDKDDAFVAGGPGVDTWAKGEFKLNFSTGAGATDYKSMWEQNMRYVYMIDFTDLLTGAALSFTVDVDSQPWENYDGTGGDGEVDIVVAGQPTAANMNTVVDNGTWYIASQTGTATPPTTAQWAQVVRDESWDMSSYNFSGIEKDNKFKLSFKNVIFNTKDGSPDPVATTITLTLPDGYTAVASTTGGTPIKISGTAPTFIISAGNESDDAFITITNTNNEYSTSASLQTAIEAVDATGVSLTYKGKETVVLTDMEPQLTTTGDLLTVRLNTVVPTVGAKPTNGVWTWVSASRTATYTKD